MHQRLGYTLRVEKQCLISGVNRADPDPSFLEDIPLIKSFFRLESHTAEVIPDMILPSSSNTLNKEVSNRE